MLLDLMYGTPNARDGGWQKNHKRNQQQRCIELFRAERLNEASQPLVEPLTTNLIVNLLPYLPPLWHRPLQPQVLPILYSPIKRHPGQHLGVSEVLPWSPDFPDALV